MGSGVSVALARTCPPFPITHCNTFWSHFWSCPYLPRAQDHPLQNKNNIHTHILILLPLPMLRALPALLRNSVCLVCKLLRDHIQNILLKSGWNFSLWASASERELRSFLHFFLIFTWQMFAALTYKENSCIFPVEEIFLDEISKFIHCLLSFNEEILWQLQQQVQKIRSQPWSKRNKSSKHSFSSFPLICKR